MKFILMITKNYLNKNKVIEIILFIIGLILSYLFLQIAESLLNKLAKYLAGMVLLSSVLIFYSKSSVKLRYLLLGIFTALSYYIIILASYHIKYFSSINKEILLVFITSISFIFFNKIRIEIKYLLTGIILSIVFYSVISSYKTIEKRIEDPKEWDFLCYYLNGKVAIEGLNYYDPNSYIKVFNETEIPIKTDYAFYRETVEVAIQYFPQSIFLFVPLGFFDFFTAHVLWDIFLTFFLIADIFLIHKIFFKESGFKAYLFVIPLFLLFHAVWYSIIFESYTFIMLFILLLIWKENNENLMGLWISIGIALKPIMLILFVYTVLRKKWKACLYTILYTFLSIIITTIFFGSSTVLSFFTRNTIQNLPDWSYIDNVNQSLLPFILRLTNYDFTLVSPLFHPVYLIIGSIITIFTFGTVYKFDKSKDDFALAIFTLFMLIIYPSTLNHYILLAIPSIFFLITNINKYSKFSYLIFFLIVISYFFMFFIPFITILILWLITISLAIFDSSIYRLQLKGRLKSV